MKQQELVVIGGGPAGVEAACTAAQAGRQVTLVSEGPVGGRAGWHSLLPSKVWLAAAAKARAEERLPNMEQILAAVAETKRTWNEQEARRLEALNVRVLDGLASFASDARLVVNDAAGRETAVFTGVPAIVAAGSVPFFPPALKPDGRRVLAPRFLSKLDHLPPRMLVIGAGATGCESAYLFNALGVEVTWIVDQFGILPQLHAPLGVALGVALEQQGVRAVRGQMVERLEREEERVTAVLVNGARYAADIAFVAIGRRPDWGRLNLPAAGLEPDQEGAFAVDAYGQTENPLVFLVGDAAGGAMTANKAEAQGRVAALRLCGRDTAPFNQLLVTQPVFTEPQVAQVGQLSGPNVAISRAPFAASLKGHMLPQEGFLDLAYDRQNGLVRGAAAFGPHAADLLAPVVVALKLGGALPELAELYGAYPTLSELPFKAARSALAGV